MADLKQDKNAMARTLGAAFLNHQVEELSKKTQAADQQLWPRERRGSRGGGPRVPQRNARQPRNDEYNKGTRNVDGEHSCEREDRSAGKKDANVVVVDASVLVHALGQLKAWCRNGREEVVIVPLEALNTLDLLKKGTSPLAHRARAASRILEQQVGTNPRIKVQRDEAYVLWDNIPFAKEEQANDEATSPGPPEWLRRTISCARWEFDHAEQPAAEGEGDNGNVPPPMTVAVCLETATVPVPDTLPAAVNSPVPLPPPQASKHEQRCSGALVAHWAKQAGMHVLECKATPLPQPPFSARHARVPSDEDWRMSSPPRNINNASSRPKPGSVRMKGPGPIVEKPNVYGPGRGGGALVERPAATMAMNASMMQMSKPIRVLARGEKLEP